MNDSANERSIGLIGKNNLEIIEGKTVLICGLGGVGGTTLEALARSGFRKFVLIDFDTVTESNLNRQVLYFPDAIGKKKVDIAKEFLKKLDENIIVNTIDCKIDDVTIEKIHQYSIDFIVDAIDDINGKVAIASYANKNNIPLIVSLGMANRLCPSMVNIAKLNQTTDDPLAKKLRYEFKHNGIDISNISVVWSKEKPCKDKAKLNSMVMVPSSAGLNIAFYLINKCMEEI